MDLRFFKSENIFDSSHKFFKEVLDINVAPAIKSEIEVTEFLQDQLTDRKLLEKIGEARFVGMINTLSLNGHDVNDIDTIFQKQDDDYDMLLVFALRINNNINLTKTDISRITRALNRKSFNRPVVVLISYGHLLSFSAAERGQYKKSSQKGEKIGRISILKEINIENVHAGHERILFQLRINPLQVNSFKDLYEQWLEVFNIKLLNKDFYNELFTWYLWAVKTVAFPYKVDNEKEDRIHNSENVIRLLTRLIFIWFIKEKKLIPEILFDKESLQSIIKKFNPIADNNSDYYKSILQNLFFATLNTEMPKDGGSRKFLDEKSQNNSGYSEEYMDHLSYRYKELFFEPENAIKLFENVPFLNGGLFECLDHRDPETNEEIRIDGFSSKTKKQPIIPNILFFGTNNDLDLSAEFEDGGKHKHAKARGIINILNSYKFTLEENTPLEQEIALDPELLGKIFENLLASYNPETRMTARKQTGSYYTPREIVNYMLDESLIAYLNRKLTGIPDTFQHFGGKQTNFLGNSYKNGQLDIQINLVHNKWLGKEEKLDKCLRKLFSYENDENPFEGDIDSTNAIIVYLSDCKILDPACGSGAFLMGILHKIVLALGKLDPCNFTWKKAQLDKANRDKKRAEQFEDENLRSEALKNANEKIHYIESSFGETGHELDYARKLFLIENCIYGVDIQQIAVQISKLRFFISLMVNQRIDDSKPNRNILSLPNLETKFVAANTLIPIEKPVQGTLISMDRNVKRIETELHEIRQRIFFTRKWKDKKLLKKLEFDKRQELKRALMSSGFPSSSAGQIASWDPFAPLNSAPFFDPEIMFAFESNDLGGFFDIITGNPPYIAFQRMDPGSKKIYQSIKYKTFESTGDIYQLFYERGCQLLHSNGILSFITSRQWMQASYGKSLRRFLSQDSNPCILIDFGQIRIFEGTTVFVCILILENARNNNYLKACILPNIYNIEQENLSSYFNSHYQKITKLNESTWSLSDSLKINDLIEKIGKPLKNWIEIEFFRGITSGLNEAFHIAENTKNELIEEDPKNVEIIKPLLRGKDIKRYGYDFENLYIINSHNGVRENGVARIDVPKNYPIIYQYLKQWQAQLEDRLDKGEHWTNLRNCAFLFEFDRPKIVWIEISDRANYAYDDRGMYLTNSAYFLTCKNNNVSLKYLLAVLNSKVADFYFSHKTARIAGGRMRYTKQYVEQIPIPEISYKEQKPFIALVNIILFLKNQTLENSSEKIMHFFFEHVIDVAVAELYFKEQLAKEKFEIIKHLHSLPDNEDKLSLEKIQNIYNDFNKSTHPVRYAITFLKNYEPMKTIEESLNRKDV